MKQQIDEWIDELMKALMNGRLIKKGTNGGCKDDVTLATISQPIIESF